MAATANRKPLKRCFYLVEFSIERRNPLVRFVALTAALLWHWPQTDSHDGWWESLGQGQAWASNSGHAAVRQIAEPRHFGALLQKRNDTVASRCQAG